ncbi:MAG: hypothetical protein GY756_03085 [bacterium]|nr:hypothetical protein [bacterium]
MDKKIIMVMVLCMTVTAQVFAQQNENPSSKDNPQFRSEKNRPEFSEPLTDKQKAQVKAILSMYDVSSLTVNDAKAIHDAFFIQNGLRAGPALDAVIRGVGFDPFKLRDLAPPPDRNRDDGRGSNTRQKDRISQNLKKYNIEQAMSDRAQITTIAFSAVAFITGKFGASTFIPPGKVCDYFGFQYMRDIDATGKGHNPMFLNRVVGNVMHVLSDKQKKLFKDLATVQTKKLKSLALKRFPLIKAFHRELDGNLPSGSSGLNENAVVKYVGKLFEFDADLSFARAKTFGTVAASLTAKQKKYFGKMKFGDFNTWPNLNEKSSILRGKSRLFNVAYMTYASEFFSWYAGSIKADTYFCPERHGTYFGGFYMKDMPAMGVRDYDIDTGITGNIGETFLALLNPEQRSLITEIITKQRKPLQEIVEVRKDMSRELRKFLHGKQANKAKVLAYGKRYGELDGELSWYYVTAFAKVNQTLTTAQRAKLDKLRNLSGYKMAPAYIYSAPMKSQPALPETDHFFFAPKS